MYIYNLMITEDNTVIGKTVIGDVFPSSCYTGET